jgi:UDP-glucose 4-epimerase
MEAGRQILVTGAAGGVGRAVGRVLRARGFRVRGLVRPEDDSRGLCIDPADLTVGYVEDPRAVGEALGDAKAVVNCAALLPRDLDLDPEQFHRVNVVGARNVLRQAADRGVSHAVFFSTISVLDHNGRNPGPAALFDYVPGPHDPYLASKIAAEQALRAEAASFLGAVSVLRLAFVYGPDNYAVWEEPLRLARQGKLSLIGGGRAPLPLLYADDIGTFVADLLDSPSQTGAFGVHVLASAEPTTLRDVFDFVADRLGVKRPSSLPATPLRLAAALVNLLPRRLRRGRLKLLTPARVRQYSRGYDLSGLLRSPVGVPTPTGYRDGLARMLDDYLRREPRAA